MSKIIDTVGRVVTIEYKEDPSFTVGPITNVQYGAEESWKASQNPNTTDSGDLQGKFQVIVTVPGNKTIVYDKTAALVSPSKHVVRTRLQRVFDVDGKPKYHYWYEQPDLGFTYMNGTSYAVYNRHENLVQIDYTKTNKIKRYNYNTYTKKLHKGSMQYRKIFAKQDLIKKSYDASQGKFLDKFVTEVKNKLNYAYTNEPDGFGFDGYKEYDPFYLRNTYRYFTKTTDISGNETQFTYDGIHQLLNTVKSGNHKEVMTTERDEMKLVKKKETLSYHVENGEAAGEPLKRIENFRYDEYGNLTNYTGPEAERDENGIPVNNEHTVVYAYAYDKFHILTLKTWKKDANTTSQIKYDVDDKGNVIKETKINTDDAGKWIITDYSYDHFGNMTRKAVQSGGGSFVTNYEYGVDANGADMKGAYLTKKYGTLDGKEVADTYAYDFQSGNLTAEIDPKMNKTTYEYDVLNRVTKVTRPDGTQKEYLYEDNPYANLKITYKDPEQVSHQYEYDIYGDLLQSRVFDKGEWHVLKRMEFDAHGNKTKETDANGHSVRYEYDSRFRLVKKSYYADDAVFKGAVTVDYKLGSGTNGTTPLLVTITDEEGYAKKYHYDILNRLTKKEDTPDNSEWHVTKYTYDYVGNKLTATDPRGHTTRYEYDDLGRMTKRTDALGNETEYIYNALNKLTRQQEPGGKITEYAYDGLGRVTEKKVHADGSSNEVYTRYAYDDADNVTNLKLGKVAGGKDLLASDITYAYDSMNRVTMSITKSMRQERGIRSMHTTTTATRLK
jgi:YD repeat-containing protein